MDGYLPYADLVPQGKAYYYTKNLDPSLVAAGVGAQTKQAVDFMRANSPLFSRAYNARLSERIGLAFVPVMGGGGQVNSRHNIAFGVNAGVRPDGSIVYPAYIIAHELGHENQRNDRNNAAWNISPEWGSPERRIAPNSAEWYAYHFAEQVSREIRQNTGVNIGTERNYWAKQV